MAPRSSAGARRVRDQYEHRTSEGQEGRHEGVGDGAEPDQADAPAADLARSSGDHVDLLPAPRPQLVLHPTQVAGDPEQRAEHPLGDGGGVEPGGVGQRHPGGGEGVEVVAGDADARLLDERQLRGVGHGAGVEAAGGEAPVVDHELGLTQHVGDRSGESSAGATASMGRPAVSWAVTSAGRGDRTARVQGGSGMSLR